MRDEQPASEQRGVWPREAKQAVTDIWMLLLLSPENVSVLSRGRGRFNPVDASQLGVTYI